MSLAEKLPGYFGLVETTLPTIEAGRLLLSPVWRGENVPHGDGRPVLVIPPVGGSDFQPPDVLMRDWLKRIKYSPVASGLLWNMGRIERQVKKVEASAEKAATASGENVTIIGHSAGGAIALDIAARRADIIREVILLGAPPDGDVQGSVIWFGKILKGNNLLHSPVGRQTREDVNGTIPITCIYGTSDQMIPDKAHFYFPGVRTIAVNGSHSGMLNNPRVYEAIASILSEGKKNT
jgi:pimeloyl-ACP methyl ester carboxylesterase